MTQAQECNADFFIYVPTNRSAASTHKKQSEFCPVDESWIKIRLHGPIVIYARLRGELKRELIQAQR